MLKGIAVLRVGDEDRPVSVGSLVFVKAQTAHAFHSVREELHLLVVFGPAERAVP